MALTSALAVILDLTKARITAAVLATTATGYLLAARRFEPDMGMPLLGVFLLASGSAALNQWQERKLDGCMARTRRRPIPAGRIAPARAFFVAVLLVLAGSFFLASVRQNAPVALALGGVALAWYNGVYTWLKRVTAFAVVPGALVGAISPMIGYVSAGGSLAEPEILLVGLFFFLWQIPHFWLLVMMYGDEYQEAGLPTVASRFSERQLVRISFVWVLATAVAGLSFAALNRVGMGLGWNWGLVAASVWLAVKAVALLGHRPPGSPPPFRRAFLQINAYAMMVMICLSLGAVTG